MKVGIEPPEQNSGRVEAFTHTHTHTHTQEHGWVGLPGASWVSAGVSTDNHNY